MDRLTGMPVYLAASPRLPDVVSRLRIAADALTAVGATVTTTLGRPGAWRSRPLPPAAYLDAVIGSRALVYIIDTATDLLPELVIARHWGIPALNAHDILQSLAA